MCLWEFIRKEHIENKRNFCKTQCSIAEFACCGISDLDIETLRASIDLKIAKLNLVKKMLDS